MTNPVGKGGSSIDAGGVAWGGVPVDGLPVVIAGGLIPTMLGVVGGVGCGSVMTSSDVMLSVSVIGGGSGSSVSGVVPGVAGVVFGGCVGGFVGAGVSVSVGGKVGGSVEG